MKNNFKGLTRAFTTFREIVLVLIRGICLRKLVLTVLMLIHGICL